MNDLAKWHDKRIKDWKWYFEKIAEIIAKKYTPRKVLDVGCSDGLLLECFYKYGAECYGVDISKKALSFAPKEKLNLFIVDIEKENLPFKDESFDLVDFGTKLPHHPNSKHIVPQPNSKQSHLSPVLPP
ncbi:MAG: Methyltransferase domain, partial [Thermoanaerobacter sp.]|nr:Methyltransferase domain [Thermoanaerobacter sp.]